MIMRIALAVVGALLLASVTGVALEWDEIAALATPTVGSSGEPLVVFSVELTYDQRPSDASLSFGWTVYELGSGAPIELHTFYRSTTFAGGGLKISFASARVPIEPGKRYRGHAVVDDAVNDLHYERDINYTAPLSLPIGIRLEGVGGAEEFDLSGVPDEELEEMATAYDALQANYDQVAEGVTLDAFFSDYASADDGFPATVFLIPISGAEGTFGPSSSPITFTAMSFMHIFPVPERSAVAGLLEQLSVYEKEFVGRAFEGEPHDALFGARTVFVGEESWKMLAASATEEKRRLSP